MPTDPDMMKAVEAEEERRKLTDPEHVERLAKTADVFAKMMKAWQHKMCNANDRETE